MGRSIVVVGAGIAGLSCATVLSRAGHQVTVLDKARGPGGRCSTRRNDPWHFDHGAQYFTARDQGFTQQVDRWLEAGVVAPWEGHVVTTNADGETTALKQQPIRYIGVPGMNAIPRAMVQSLTGGIDLQVSNAVTHIHRNSAGWSLTLASGDTLDAEFVVVTAPPVQTTALIDTVCPVLAKRVARVSMTPCWALMLGFDESPESKFDAAFVSGGPIGWISSSRNKPGRDSAATWMVHASDSFSHLNLESSAAEVTEQLKAAFDALLGSQRQAQVSVAHRWRYARADDPLDVQFMKDDDDKLWIAGDWCAGSRLEGAWNSGQAAAQDLLLVADG